MTLHIDKPDLDSIRRHGEDAYPGECCGYLAGSVAGSAKRVACVAPLKNEHPDSGRGGFLITPESYLEADRSARSRGLEILGFYHSHPDAPARPSRRDLERAWPAWSCVIVSVSAAVAGEIAAWVPAADRSCFEVERIAGMAGADSGRDRRAEAS